MNTFPKLGNPSKESLYYIDIPHGDMIDSVYQVKCYTSFALE